MLTQILILMTQFICLIKIYSFNKNIDFMISNQNLQNILPAQYSSASNRNCKAKARSKSSKQSIRRDRMFCVFWRSQRLAILQSLYSSRAGKLAAEYRGIGNRLPCFSDF